MASLQGTTVNNYLRTLEQVRAMGWYGTPTGTSYTALGAELGVSGGEAYLLCYNRDTSAYGVLNIAGSASNLRISGSVFNLQTGSLQQAGNQVLHAGNVATYALPIGGGTLTGALNGTSAAFSGAVSGASLSISGASSLNRINLNSATNAIIQYRSPGQGTSTLNFPFYNNVSNGSICIEMADNDTGGLMIDNEGVTVYGAGDIGEVFRVIDEDVYQSNSNITLSRTFWINQGLNGGGGILGAFTISGNTAIHAGNVATYALPIGGGTLTGGLSGTTGSFSGDLSIAGYYQIRGGDPTITFRDTNNRTAYIHVNNDIFYVLSGPADSAFGNWGTVANGRWPMELNISNNNATFGADVNAISFTGAGTGLTGTASSLSIGGNSANVNISNLATQQVSISLAAGSWYTIAANDSNRASAKFTITDTSSGLHQAIHFYATAHYGTDSGAKISVISNTYYGGPPVSAIKIMKGSTYDGAMVQIYAMSACALTVSIYDNQQSSGWVIKSGVVSTTNPGTVAAFASLTTIAAAVDLSAAKSFSVSDEIYIGGATTQYKALHTNNYNSYALPLSGGAITGNSTFSADNYLTFGPNSSWSRYLRIGGNGYTAPVTTTASVVTTNGNLHLDAAKAAGMAIYLNWYGGAGGTIFGNGSGTQVGAVDSAGNTSFIGTLAITGAITGASFSGAGTGLTGTAASLTAGAVPWSGITSKPTTLAGFGITDAAAINGASNQTFSASAIYQYEWLRIMTDAGIYWQSGTYAGWHIYPQAAWGMSLRSASTDCGLQLRRSDNTLLGSLYSDGTSIGFLNASNGWGASFTIAGAMNRGSVPGSLVTGNISGNAGSATNVSWSGITSKPTTLSGFGITDALPLAGGALTGTVSIDTSGTGVNSTVAIKRSGQGVVNFGSYAGSWRSALQIQSNANDRMLFFVPPEADYQYGVIRSINGGLKIDVGGTTGNGGGNAISIETSGAVSMPGTLNVVGAVTQNGNQVLHAGNYIGSYIANETSYTTAINASGYTWIRIPYASGYSFNDGQSPVEFYVTRSIFANGSTPYGGPTAKFIIQSNEWHNGQQMGTVQYGERGDSASLGAANWITHAKVTNLAGGGYWMYLRLKTGTAAGVTYYIRRSAVGGQGLNASEIEVTTDPGGAATLYYGFNLISAGNEARFYRDGNQVLDAGNYTSYPDATKLPLAGGTLTGSLFLSSVTAGTSTTCLVLESNGEVRTKVNAASSGSSGSSGANGGAGGAGPPGPPGGAGGTGSSGSSGSSGANGGPGGPGGTGSSGSSGSSGANGGPGGPGGPGGTGSSGSSGSSGANGGPGGVGPPGPPGSPGSGTSGSSGSSTASALVAANSYTVAELNVSTSAYPSLYVTSTGGAASIRLLAYSSSNYIQSATSAGSGSADLIFSSGGAASEWMRILGTNGNIGIKTASPGYHLDVNGNVHAVSHPTSSDVRFKKNIKPIENALSKVLKLRGVKYEWNEFINNTRDGYDLNSPIIGFIAQELELIVPELVSKWKLNEDCQDARAVDYPRVVVLLTEAIKEQQAQINDLKTRISILENK